MLYLNVDGLTNLAIAEGTVCRFTRVVGSGLEGMASELAERRSIALAEARALLAAVDLGAPAPAEQELAQPHETDEEVGSAEDAEPAQAPGEGEPPVSPEEAEESERAMSYEELTAVESVPARAGAAIGRGSVDGARERHPRHLRRGPQLARLPPLPGGRRRGLARRA